MPSPQTIHLFECGIAIAVLALCAFYFLRKKRTVTATYSAELQGENDDPTTIDSYREQIACYVATGFMSRNEIIELVTEMADDECPQETYRPKIEQMTDEAIRAHTLAQQSWPAVTDCDRLDAAFAELEQAGIICRQNYTCCQTCGIAEIWPEMEAQRDAGRDIVGYAFYHSQDTEAAADGASMYLSYGSMTSKPKPALAVAHQVIAALNLNDLKTHWDGTIGQRIYVAMDWKRRSTFDQNQSTHPRLGSCTHSK